VKTIKLASGRVIKMYSVRLANGNLSVPTRDGMVEVPPSDPRYKRWLPWAVEPNDPRIAEEPKQ